MSLREETDKYYTIWNKQFRKERMKRFFADLVNRAIAGLIGGLLAGLLLYYLVWQGR